MGRGADRAVKQLTNRRGLSPKQQRKLWARVSALKHVLKAKGILTEEDLEELVRVENAMERDILKKVSSSIKKKEVT